LILDWVRGHSYCVGEVYLNYEDVVSGVVLYGFPDEVEVRLVKVSG